MRSASALVVDGCERERCRRPTSDQEGAVCSLHHYPAYAVDEANDPTPGHLCQRHRSMHRFSTLPPNPPCASIDNPAQKCDALYTWGTHNTPGPTVQERACNVLQQHATSNLFRTGKVVHELCTSSSQVQKANAHAKPHLGPCLRGTALQAAILP